MKRSLLTRTLSHLRDLNRQRFYLVDTARDLKRKIIAMMDRIFPEYQDFFSNMFPKTSVQIMKEYRASVKNSGIDFFQMPYQQS